MKIKSYNDFFVTDFELSESEEVKLDKSLREYELQHKSGDLFIVKSDDFQKEFFVKPYNSESVKLLPDVQERLEKAIQTLNVEDLYNSIKAAERIPYEFGKIFTSLFDFKNVPELSISLDPDLQRTLQSSEKEFLMNNFNQLNKETKDLVISTMRERAELLCVSIEALFYFLRSEDKDKFYQNLSSDEILKIYKEKVEEAAKESQFSVEGPFSDIKTKAQIDETSETAFWECEKDQKTFIIKATISPSKLHSEDNIGGTSGLKFSLSVSGKPENDDDFNFFSIEELKDRAKLFNSKILKKT